MSKKVKFALTQDGTTYLENLKLLLHDKYFNIFLSMYSFEGEEIDYRKNRYILKKLYYEGRIGAFKAPQIDTLEFADFAPQDWDIYDMPVHARLVNKKHSKLIPNKIMEIDKDLVICYLLSSKSSIFECIDWYVDRIALIEGVMRNNLYTHNMPFLLALSPEDKAKLNVIVKKLFSLDPAIAVDFTNLEDLKLLNLNPTYILDKLYKYKRDLENELLTYLGVNNTGLEKQERMLVDEVNANNEEIANNGDKFLKPLEEFCNRVSETLGVTISVKRNQEEREDIKDDNQLIEEN